MSREYLPVRVVQPNSDFLHKNSGGGSKPKWFIEENEYSSHQAYLVDEIDDIEIELSTCFTNYPDVPSVIKASLHFDALAKSHRPKSIFNEETCPIIGVDSFGELLLSTTKQGLDSLKLRIKESSTEKQRANVTSVVDIKIFDSADKLQGLDVHELKSRASRDGELYLKVILFNYQDDTINGVVENKFTQLLQSQNTNVDKIVDLKNLSIWRIIGKDMDVIEELCQNPSVKTVSYFPSFEVVTQKSLQEKIFQIDYPTPENGVEYPKVGVIDSGISKDHPTLNPWIIERTNYDPDVYQNNFHGSFVAGLVCMGSHLNGDEICPDAEMIKIVDVQILPDPLKQKITEDELILRLLDSIPTLSQRHQLRIWNMSLSLSVSIKDEKFSSLGSFLDVFQEKNNIILTLPSGNYEHPNQREWPPQDNIGNDDRLQVPADSVRAITVGAIACKENNDSIVKKNQPASYSCKGPGPSYIVKPELIHYSGNVGLNGGTLHFLNQGIRSFDENGCIAEDVGTSFACPLVARTLAILDHKLDSSTSNNLIKALAIHYSQIPDEVKIHNDILPYVGFGVPTSINNILNCTESSITLVFEQEIYEGHSLKYPFVWPESLRDENGKCRGDVKMTLVAGVPLDSNFGSEYIRANITASLGAKTFDKKKNEYKFTSKLKENPKLEAGLYEDELIKNGYKWKPIKKYEGNFRGIKTDEWKIRVSMLLRDGISLDVAPLKFALIFTLSDPKGLTPVYDEVVRGLENENVITNPLKLRSDIQQRINN
ncbi:MAG: S8 family serine peptidase [Methanosarcinaceae archaeon]|nr:S8 family serine peptidase [Methanosarcinaceae archaeon]